VKFWGQNEYPQLAANEFFCLRVAEECGLEVPPDRLAEDALALVIDRFDLRPDPIADLRISACSMPAAPTRNIAAAMKPRS
jgi:HipA-like C-terminal domain